MTVENQRDNFVKSTECSAHYCYPLQQRGVVHNRQEVATTQVHIEGRVENKMRCTHTQWNVIQA